MSKAKASRGAGAGTAHKGSAKRVVSAAPILYVRGLA